jgi:hypothetical protein
MLGELEQHTMGPRVAISPFSLVLFSYILTFDFSFPLSSPPQKRYSITVTYDGPTSTVKTYRDGEVVGMCQDYPYKPSEQPLSTALFIGRSVHQVYHEYMNAEFKCFRIYNRALSAQEIVQDTCHTGLFGVAPAE